MGSLTRQEFNTACTILLKEDASIPSVDREHRIWLADWEWREHALFKTYGYLFRKVQRSYRDYIEEESVDSLGSHQDEDSAALQLPKWNLPIDVELSIAYSASFQVPVLYILANDAGVRSSFRSDVTSAPPGGAPASLDGIIRSDIFRSGKTAEYPLAASNDENAAQFPTLSLGEHPVTGQHCFSLHPCNTSRMVTEILTSCPTEDDPPIAFLKTWLMITNHLVDLS